MKKTSKMTFTYFLYMLTAVLGIGCVIFKLSMLFRISVTIMAIISILAVLNLSYCPNCGRFGIRIRPFLKQEPCCKKCGKRP